MVHMSNPYRAPEEISGDHLSQHPTVSDRRTRIGELLFFMLLTAGCGVTGLMVGGNPDGNPKAGLALLAAAGLFFACAALVVCRRSNYAAILMLGGFAAIASSFFFGWSS